MSIQGVQIIQQNQKTDKFGHDIHGVWKLKIFQQSNFTMKRNEPNISRSLIPGNLESN